jgi:hypothetical protein
MNQDSILDGRDVYGMSLESWIRSDKMELLARRRRLKAPEITDLAAVEPIPVRVNHGRWVWECPLCHGAEMAFKDLPVGYCWTCGNVWCGGLWVPLAFPAESAEIEGALAARPLAQTRNWYPDESVDDLHVENRERAAEIVGEARNDTESKSRTAGHYAHRWKMKEARERTRKRQAKDRSRWPG